VEVKE